MIRKMLVVLLSLAVISGAANAAGDVKLGGVLVDVIASEELCNYRIDQKKLEALIIEKIGADDTEFAKVIALNSSLMKDIFAEMSRSARTAHCVQMRRLAVTYHLAE